MSDTTFLWIVANVLFIIPVVANRMPDQTEQFLMKTNSFFDMLISKVNLLRFCERK